MPYPTIIGYIESLTDPCGLLSTLGNVVCERDHYGQPRVAAGGNAAVFRLEEVGEEFAMEYFPEHAEHDQCKSTKNDLCNSAETDSCSLAPACKKTATSYSLKCFLRPVEYHEAVCGFLQNGGHPLLCRSVYLPREIFVFGQGNANAPATDAKETTGEWNETAGKTNGMTAVAANNTADGEWHDVVVAEWAPGRTLDWEMRKAIHRADGALMAELAAIFDRAATMLLKEEWAHGDVKPENIIVSPAGELKLIDYDSIFVPQLAGLSSNQTGTPLWQHPRRNGHYFNRHIDDYSLALLSATLHCLSLDISLYDRYGKGDVFLFDPAAIIDDSCESHIYCMEMAALCGNAPLYRLLDMLRSPTPHIAGLGRVLEAFDRQALCSDPSCANASRTVSELTAFPSTNNLLSSEHSPLSTPYPTPSQPPRRTLSAFRENGLWGYMDGNGRVVIAPLYDSALEFSGGTATVSLGPYRHIINENGQLIIEN